MLPLADNELINLVSLSGPVKGNIKLAVFTVQGVSVINNLKHLILNCCAHGFVANYNFTITSGPINS